MSAVDVKVQELIDLMEQQNAIEQQQMSANMIGAYADDETGVDRPDREYEFTKQAAGDQQGIVKRKRSHLLQWLRGYKSARASQCARCGKADI